MSLFQELMEPCRRVEKTRAPDGESGSAATWTEGSQFCAAIVLDRSEETRAAERQGLARNYTVTCEPGVRLGYHDVFRRLRDGAVFRVTSSGEDVHTPPWASFQFSQAAAERWELTT